MKIGTVKSLIPTFFESFFSEALNHSPEYSAAHLDLSYLKKRYNSEGVRFVTHLLPLLGKSVETSLITLTPLQVPKGFALAKDERLPLFLNFPLKQGFSSSGYPLYDVRDSGTESAKAFSYWFYLIRQVTLAFSKVSDAACSMTEEEAIKAALDRVTQKPSISCQGYVMQRAKRLLHNIFIDDGRIHPMLAQWIEIPFGRHGPGAVFSRERPCQKWNFSRVKGIDPLLYKWRDEPLAQEWVPGYSRFCAVPKDFKSLRTICIESKELQFAQQGLMRVLCQLIEMSPLTRRSISFTDQSKNAEMCKHLKYSTIDLKDASDRVSKTLCRMLLPKEIFSLLTRFSSRGILYNGVSYRLESVATMGSAVCFPIETIVFWALARAAIELVGERPILRVFGDDIICPKRAYHRVVDVLERCGLVINPNKTCHETLVRESCGAYYWDGFDVRIVRFPRTASDSVEAWLGIVEAAKGFAQSGFDCTYRAILTTANEYIEVPYLEINKRSVNRRYNKALQRAEVRMPSLRVRKAGDALPGYTAMYAQLVGNDTRPPSNGTVKVKWTWEPLK